MPAHQPPPAELFFTAVGFIRRQFLVVLSVLPLAIGLGAAYLYVTPPLYQGVARILIDPSRVQVFKQSILEGPADWAMVDSQIEILKSENFAETIINKLNLTQDHEFVSSNGGIGGIVSSPFRLLHLVLRKPVANSDITLDVVDAFEKRLTVSRVGATFVIEIEFLSTDPDRAAQIANAVADGFIVDQMESKAQTIGKATTWLQERLNELRAQASAAEGAVVEYKSKHNIVDAGGHPIYEGQLAQLNTELVNARSDVAEAEARLDTISQILRAYDLNQATAVEMSGGLTSSPPRSRQGQAVTDTLHDAIITKLRGQYLDLAQRESLFSKKYGHDHLAVVNLRNQMEEIRRSIIDELKQIAESLRSDYNIAKAREDSVEKRLAAAVTGSQAANKAEIELRQLETTAQSYRGLYDGFQQRYADSVQQQSFPVPEARVITRASRPLGKTSPKSLRILGLATMGGLALGLALAVLRELSDRVFRTSNQVEKQLNTQCLALVPKIKPDGEVPSIETNAPADIPTSRIIPLRVGLCRTVIELPLSRFAEAIRAVKVSADLGRVIKSNKVIGITSSLPNEGKSTIAAALAQLCAHGGARVILVDCDLRQPSISQELAPNATAGLIDVITKSASLEDVIWADPSTGLSFLPVVAKSRLIHTNEILASDALKRLFDRLRGSYDYVIVDLSPLAPVVDVRSTAHLVDSYVFVIEWGKTKIDVVEHALNAAHGVYDNLLGVVLNKVDLNRLMRYESHRRDYYYNRYYANYGYSD